MPEIIAYDFNDLKNAVTSGLYDNIILGNDITIQWTGISIPSTTTQLTIDGQDPITGSKHTILDYNSADINDTIYVNALSSITRIITIKNVIMQIRNYYSLIGVYDSSVNQNVTIIFQNIDFLGVQAFYNRQGKCIIKDSTFVLDKLFGSVNPSSELAEANSIQLIGKVDIISYSTSFPVIWFPSSNPSFKVLEGAEVNVYTTNRELIYANYPIEFTLENNSKFIADCNFGMFIGTGTNRATAITINENAVFEFQQRALNGSIPTIRCDNFFAYTNSSVIIKVNYASSASLVQMTLNGGILNINDPKHFVLYNYGNRVLEYSAGTGNFSANAEQFNFWQTSSEPTIAGGINDLPLQSWRKKNLSNVQVIGTVTNTVTSISSSNIIVPQDSTVEITSLTYPIHSCRGLSYGKIPFSISKITDNSDEIIGNTEPNTTIKINIESKEYLIVSNENGDFNQTLDILPFRDSEIIILGANTFLYFSYIITVMGSLKFLLVPKYLDFRNSGIPANKQFLLRKNRDWAILVKDTRVNGSNWSIYAKITGPLQTTYSQINDGLLFVDLQTQVLQEEPIKIYDGQGNNADETITEIKWSELEGVIINLVPDFLYQGGLYQTNIVWILKEQIVV